jgi:thiol-disulfide isomerase/thioredoxin
MKTSLLTLGLTVTLGAFTSSVSAAETSTKPVSDKTLADFTVGEIISGDKVDMKAMAGKVVVVEFWGRNCGPCLASMPHLEELNKRYKSKGLQIIGVHAQDGTDDEILKAVKDTKVKYPIARTGRSPIDFSGIPKMFVFNTKGQIVFDGHPAEDDADKVIKRELRTATATPDAKGTPFAKPTSTAPEAALVAERTWTSTDGRPMVATLISVDANGIGKFKRKDGAVFDVPVTKFNDADRKLIDEAKSKKDLSAN